MRRLLLLAITWTAALSAENLNQLVHEADGLNIEGAIIPRYLQPEGKLWANLCFVLDRPLQTHEDLIDLTTRNRYPLKESSLIDYDETTTTYATILTLRYYLRHLHEIAGKSNHEPARILVQVHRNTTGPAHIDHLQRVLKACAVDQEMHNCTIQWEYGVFRPEPDLYADIDLVISVSLAAGLNSELSTGALLLPHRFVPMDIHNMLLVRSESYEARNHLIEALPAMLAEQDSALIATINEIARSPNPEKAQYAHRLEAADFHVASLLQVTGNFNPKRMLQSYKCK